VPKSPKTAKRVSAGGIVRVFCKEMAVIGAGSKVIGGAWVKRGVEKVDFDKVPAWAKGTGRAVSNEEETVGGCSDRGEEGRTGRRGRQMGRIVIGDNRDGCSSGKGGGREGKWQGKFGIGVSVKSKGAGKVAGLAENQTLLYIWMLRGDFSGCGTGEWEWLR
jgi:hypothetical protein